LLPCVEATTHDREPRWLAPQQALSAALGENNNAVLRLFPQYMLMPVTNLLQREQVLVDVTRPLALSVALAHLATLFKVAAEHVRLYINGRLIDVARPLHGQSVSLAAQIVLQDGSTPTLSSTASNAASTSSTSLLSSSSSSVGSSASGAGGGAAAGYMHALRVASASSGADADVLLMPVGVSRAPTFAVPLDQALDTGQELPWVVLQTIALVRRRGLDVEGVFRLSGLADRIAHYKKLYDSGRAGAAWRELRDEVNMHTVAGVLKLWLRDLPESLFGSSESVITWLDTTGVTSLLQRVRAQRLLLAKLPPVNQRVLDALLELLHRTAALEATNKMGVRNLATVFGPPLTGAGQNNALLFAETNRIHQLVMHLVEEYPYVFRRRRVPASAAGDDGDDAGATTASVAARASGSALLPRPLARVLYDYDASEANELSLISGQLVVVTFEGDSEGWWQGYRLDESDPLATPAAVSNMPGSYLELTGETLADVVRSTAKPSANAATAPDDCELREPWDDDEARPRAENDGRDRITAIRQRLSYAAADGSGGGSVRAGGVDRLAELARIKQRIESEQRALRELSSARASVVAERRAVQLAEQRLPSVERMQRRQIAVAAAAAVPQSLMARVQALQTKLRSYASKNDALVAARDDLTSQLQQLSQQLNDPKKIKKKDADRIRVVLRSLGDMRTMVEQDKQLRDAASVEIAQLAGDLEQFVQIVIAPREG
jgi:hypothetical protein